MTVSEMKTRIDRIDKEVGDIRRELKRRAGRFDTLSAQAWQSAWDKCPGLQQRENALFRERGQLQAGIAKAKHKRKAVL